MSRASKKRRAIMAAERQKVRNDEDWESVSREAVEAEQPARVATIGSRIHPAMMLLLAAAPREDA